MTALIDLTGKKFVKLTVLTRAKSSNSGHTMWQCQCECGNKPIVDAGNLRSGHSTQCRSCQVSERSTTHGLRRHPLYGVWINMKARCSNKKHDMYHRYGGRGITICEKWVDSFQSFYNDMIDGYAYGLQIDRRNNDGNYEPDNCRWLTRAENMQNSSKAKLTFEQVLMIRIKNNYGISVRSLSVMYNMGYDQILAIVNGKSWKNIANENYLREVR